VGVARAGREQPNSERSVYIEEDCISSLGVCWDRGIVAAGVCRLASHWPLDFHGVIPFLKASPNRPPRRSLNRLRKVLPPAPGIGRSVARKANSGAAYGGARRHWASPRRLSALEMPQICLPPRRLRFHSLLSFTSQLSTRDVCAKSILNPEALRSCAISLAMTVQSPPTPT
jgi:hypothetical protein